MEWAIARLNEVDADIPYVFLDEPSSLSCGWYDNCHDIYGPPWPSCYSANSVVVVPSNCLPAQITFNGPPTNQSHIIHVQRSTGFDDTPSVGVVWSHAPMAAGVFEALILHELGHSLGLEHRSC